jgi:hypothetical protein
MCTAEKGDYELRYGENQLALGDWRMFRTQSGAKLYVLYWHVVGKRIMHSGQFPPAYNYLYRAGTAVWEMFFSREEQYFVRLVSTTPFEDLKSDKDFQGVMRSVSNLLPSRSA